MLTKYDGIDIIYDDIGNPTDYYNGTRWEFTWQNGRRLATATAGSTTLNFAYDADGTRTSKTVNGVTHTYIYASGMLLRETYGTNTLDFFYDASGAPYAIKYNDDLYYYITNLQGDILHIVDANGETVVSYEYGPYGQLTDTSGTMAETLGTANPLRYRGYYYDAELEMYYLQSRYYDPAVGRFINADAVISGVGGDFLGYNQFAYCFNNPVKLIDSAGNWPKLLKELGARLAHGVKIMTKIILSPLKATTFEIGSGVGFGADAKVTISGVPVEIGASATVSDVYVFDKGSHDLKSRSSANIGVNIGNIFNLLGSKGKSHSYFDEQCNCSFWDSTFGEKTNCKANTTYTSGENTLGIGGCLYIALGAEFSLTFDFDAWCDELIAINNESFSYKGYY